MVCTTTAAVVVVQTISNSGGGTADGGGGGENSGDGSGDSSLWPGAPGGPSPEGGQSGADCTVVPRRDPLVLDLDGDGIEASRQAQVGMLDAFITQWANTSDMASLQDQASALASSGVTLTVSLAAAHVNSIKRRSWTLNPPCRACRLRLRRIYLRPLIEELEI